MHRTIALGDRALIAIAAHVEVRTELRRSRALMRRDLRDVLIGSYARKVAIWPGKDVDVFSRLMGETVESISPDHAYELFGTALRSFDAQGRLVPQPRSYKVEFGPGRYPSVEAFNAAARDREWDQTRVSRVIAKLDRLEFEFAVDVVPAVRWDDRYGIPQTARVGPDRARHRTGAWHLTDPVSLTDETWARNEKPRVAGVGAFVRTVKMLKQIKAHHLRDTKPSGLYYEFALHEGFVSGEIDGESWADIAASALTYVATRLQRVDADPVCDPALNLAYQPAPSHADLAHPQNLFDGLARRARRAISTERRCQAAIEWRHIFGSNAEHDHVFRLPAGCRETGHEMGAAAANVATGGTAERSFGDR